MTERESSQMNVPRGVPRQGPSVSVCIEQEAPNGMQKGYEEGVILIVEEGWENAVVACGLNPASEGRAALLGEHRI